MNDHDTIAAGLILILVLWAILSYILMVIQPF